MLRDIIEAFHLRFKRKKDILNYLHKEFGIKIPVNSTYSNIINEIINKEKEEIFCQKVFGTKNFQETIAAYQISQGLQSFSKEELIKIAEKLSERHPKETFKYNTIEELITSIINNANKEELTWCFEELISEEIISLRQYKRWIIGPLGVVRSISKRTSNQSLELIKILNKYIDRNNWFELYKIIKEIPSDISLLKDDPLLLTKFFQIVLAYQNDEKILKNINKLIKEDKVSIEGNFQYWDFVITPCGIFKRRYRGVEQLAEILTVEFEELELHTLLGEEGLIAATTKLRVLERCIKEKPSDILDELFGLLDLWRIGQRIGLIAPERIKDKRKLINIILLRLGFSLPPRIEGLSTLEKTLSDGRVALQDPYLDQSKRNGIMIEIYAKLESILKDIIYFYVSIVWSKEIENNNELESKKNTADQIIREHFKIDRNIDKMGLGPLINTLSQIKKFLKKNSRGRQKIKKILEREIILSNDEFKILNKIAPFRPIFEHDVRIEGIRKHINAEECRDIITKLISLTINLRKKQIYPILIRITKEVTDEYGTTYVEAIDERGEYWTIKPKMLMRSQVAHFIYSATKPVTIHPFIVEKFW